MHVPLPLTIYLEKITITLLLDQFYYCFVCRSSRSIIYLPISGAIWKNNWLSPRSFPVRISYVWVRSPRILQYWSG